MKKKMLAVLAVLLLIVGAGVYTYARYTNTYEGTGNAEVAKWAVSLKQDGTAVTESFTLKLTPSTSADVAAGKIAPGSSVSATLVLDLTGTEVSTDYEVDLSEVTGLPEGMEITSVKATVDGTTSELTGNAGKYTGIVELANTGKPVTFVVTATWEADGNDVADTTTGKAAGTVAIPVNVTVKQHI